MGKVVTAKEFLFSDAGKRYLKEQYSNNLCSPYQIAEELQKGCYPNMVRRALKYHKIRIRTKGEAQKIALKTGRQAHPTKGTRRPQDVKKKIGKSLARSWQSLSDQERTARSRKAQEQWEKMSDTEKLTLRKLAGEGMRRASKEGSKTEHFLLVEFRGAGYQVEYHASVVIGADKMHVDLLFAEPRIAVEIDGPTHFWPVFGNEHLQKNIAADNKKNGLLLEANYVVIRVKQKAKNMSQFKLDNIYQEMLEIVEKVERKFPPVDERFFELEIV